jgi:hypothetical protein
VSILFLDLTGLLNPKNSFPRREEVDRSNTTRMSSLQTEHHTYQSTDGGSLEDPNQREKMLANFMAAKSLQLRVGAQVMLIKNVDEHLVNGSMGAIKRFVDPNVYQTEKDGDFTVNKDEAGGAAAVKKKAPVPGVVWPLVQFSTPKGVIELLESRAAKRRSPSQPDAAPAHPLVGHEHTQEPRPDDSARQGRSGEDLREG